MTINDSNWQFLQDATGLSLPFNEMYFRYLRDLGYTGTLQDMIAKSGLGLNPSEGEPLNPSIITADSSTITADASDVYADGSGI